MNNKYEFFIAGRARNKENILKELNIKTKKAIFVPLYLLLFHNNCIVSGFCCKIYMYTMK